jgi:hypothetical protein
MSEHPNAAMRSRAFASFLVITFATVACTSVHAQDSTAFVNVNVIPMDTESVLVGYTVVVVGDQIAAVGPSADVDVPSDAVVIDANGAYLMPGLADMHTHLDGDREFGLYLANGVTTLRAISADSKALDVSKKVQSGELIGPRIYTAASLGGFPPYFIYMRMVYAYKFAVVLIGGLVLFGIVRIGLRLAGKSKKLPHPLLKFLPFSGTLLAVAVIATFTNFISPQPLYDFASGSVASSPKHAERIVRQYKEAGHDFIKTQWFMSREMFDRMMTVAKELGMEASGHIPAEVGVEHYIKSGAHPEHDYQLAALLAKDYEREVGPNPLDPFDFSETTAKMPALVKLMKENGAVFTPTMTVFDALHQIFSHIDNLPETPLYKQPEFRYVPHEIMSEWTNPENEEFTIVMSVKGLSSIKEIIPEPARREEFLRISKKIVKALHEAGVPVMIGSDSSDPGVVWGFSLHRELELFVESGLTPFEALAAATRVPSEFLNSGAGTIEVGKYADLVLFPENPLGDITRTRKNAGVMVRGKWLPPIELQKMLEETEAKNKAEAAETTE